MAEQRNNALAGYLRVALERARRDGRLDVGQPLIEKSRQRRLGRLNLTLVVELGDEARALDLQGETGSHTTGFIVLGALVFLGGISLTVYGSLTRARLHQLWAREEAMTLDDPSMGPLSPIYPDPAVHILDQKFTKYWLFNASVEKLASGTRWGEGPVWFGDARCLLWSDIPNDRILKWDETTSTVSVFRHPSGNANGNARDRTGRLVTCEHSARRVTRTEYDGSITVILDRFQGKRLNSPNDVVVASDGAIWLTDPPFGLGSFYEGTIAQPELNANVYRVDPFTGEAAIAADDILGPNGLCFSPDEKRLYVVESRAVPNRKIRAFDVIDGRRLGASRVLIDAGGGTPDGFRCDMDGNIWAGWGMGSAGLDGVMIFDPEGQPIGRIALPERCANLCFGGRHRNRLFMACGHGLYALYVNARGAV